MTEPEILRIQQTSKVELTIDVDARLPGSLYRKGAFMRPDKLVIGWDQDHAGDWYRYIAVYGRTIKRTGEIGVERQSLSVYETQPDWAGGLLLEDTPNWLRHLVDRFTPPKPAL